MIKSVGLLTRKPELSHADFMRHWLEIHAPLAHAVPGVRRYVQNHIIEERRRADIPTTEVEVDGIAELWYDDRAAMDLANASPEAKRLHDDGALFIGRIKSFVVEEYVVSRRPGDIAPLPQCGRGRESEAERPSLVVSKKRLAACNFERPPPNTISAAVVSASPGCGGA